MITDNAAKRRAEATNEIRRLCADILADTEAGPRHRGRTTYQDADNFEAIQKALEEARFRSICMRGAA